MCKNANILLFLSRGTHLNYLSILREIQEKNSSHFPFRRLSDPLQCLTWATSQDIYACFENLHHEFIENFVSLALSNTFDNICSEDRHWLHCSHWTKAVCCYQRFLFLSSCSCSCIFHLLTVSKKQIIFFSYKKYT